MECQAVAEVRVFQRKRQPGCGPCRTAGLLAQVSALRTDIGMIHGVIGTFDTVRPFRLGVYPQLIAVMAAFACFLKYAGIVGTFDDHDYFLRDVHVTHCRGEIESLVYLKTVRQRIGGIVIQREHIFTGRFVHDKVAVIRMDCDDVAVRL